MFKFELYFLANGVWKNNGFSVGDRFQYVGDTFYHNKTAYKVSNVEEVEDDWNVYRLYLS